MYQRETTLNLSQVTTPADLVTQNNEPTPPNTSQLDALVEDLGLEETYTLALTLVQRLGTYHQSVIEELKEEGVKTEIIPWIEDKIN